jgi:predicted acyl esterase
MPIFEEHYPTSMMSRKRVGFRTVDGVTLRGDLYMPEGISGAAPIVVMTQGVRNKNYYREVEEDADWLESSPF